MVHNASIIIFFLITVFAVDVVISTRNCQSADNVWQWECKHDKVRSFTRRPRCVKVPVTNASNYATDLNRCKLTCGEHSMLFPKPSISTDIGNLTVPFYPYKLKLKSYTCNGGICQSSIRTMIRKSFCAFRSTLSKTMRSQRPRIRSRMSYWCRVKAARHRVNINLVIESNDDKLTLDTDESYELSITTTSSEVQVTIKAKSYYGARHGMETVSQLTAYHESLDALQIVAYAEIKDAPSYKYRGLLLDTSRNYYSPRSIKRLITALSYNKMNTLHWHITDTHSFPIEIKSVPNMLKYGSYSPRHVYTHRDIKKIVEHASFNGIRVLPEFDEPAHCGEGWQWGEKAGLGNLAVCVNREPWQQYCVEPPCGQLNPTNPNVYDVLGKIFKEYFDLFKPDIFHAGGDEINFNCWNTTKEITDWMKLNYGGVQEIDYMDMWGMFLNKSSEKIYEANGNKELPIILWTSKMTSQKYLNKYLDPKKHIIQIWSGTKDSNIAEIVKNGFRTIFSQWDKVYLDCGYGNWLVEGNNWCSPYKDWKVLYNNDPIKILEYFKVNVTSKIRESILGQEAAMWSEQVDEASSEAKIWPRTSALAERLWTNPDHDWRDAEYRMMFHRQRLVNRGINADALQPLWCEQNAGHCYWDNTVKGHA